MIQRIIGQITLVIVELKVAFSAALDMKIPCPWSIYIRAPKVNKTTAKVGEL